MSIIPPESEPGQCRHPLDRVSPRLSLHITRSEDEPRRQAQALAEQSRKLGDADRVLIIGLARKLGLSRTAIVQRWAEIDHASRAA